jgi:hypothetical protein
MHQRTSQYQLQWNPNIDINFGSGDFSFIHYCLLLVDNNLIFLFVYHTYSELHFFEI